MNDYHEEEDDDEEEYEGVCVSGEEHTGRWTKEEHSLFLDGLKKFGKVFSLLFPHRLHSIVSLCNLKRNFCNC